MTLADADKIAERIIALPRLYDAPSLTPDFQHVDISYDEPYVNAYPWKRLFESTPSFKFLYTAVGDGSFFNGGSFSEKAYVGTITRWESTPTINNHPAARYVTLDDLKMMPYVGIEYARAKILYGWRFRTKAWAERYPSVINSVETPYRKEDRMWNFVPQRGSIVRAEDGRRYICRVQPITPDNAQAIANLNSMAVKYDDWDWRLWTPMHRMPGFQEPTTGYFTWGEAAYIPSEPISNRIYLLEWIEGNNDILNIAPHSGSLDIGVLPEETMIRSGGMEIRICPMRDNGDDSFDENKSVVCYQQRVFPFYKVFQTKADYLANNSNYSYHKSKFWEEFNYNDEEKKDFEGRTRQVYEIDYVAGGVPLKKGVKYGVYAQFDNTEVVATDSRRLCSYVRTPTRMTAPYMWKSRYLPEFN